MRDDRLVGLRPRLRLAAGLLTLTHSGWRRAIVPGLVLELDDSLFEQSRGGDLLTLVRTGSADVGVSLLRDGELVWAVGAVTAVPLGNEIEIHVRPAPDFSLEHPFPRDTWLEVSTPDQESKLASGDETTIGRYTISVIRSFAYGIPGKHESLAISVASQGVHQAAVRCAHLLARPNAGLR